MRLDGNGQGCAGQVPHAPARSGLLVNLAAHGLFQRLARLHETCEAGEAAARALAVPAEQGALTADREHDDDRIGAREMRRPAIGAAPHPPGRCHPGRRAALGAEAVTRMPVDQRAGLGENRRLTGRDRRGEGADVDQLGVDVGRGAGAARVDREVRARVVVDAEQDQESARLDLPAPRGRRLPVERRLRRAAHERFQVAQGEEPRARVHQQRGDPLVVIPAGADPVERIAGEAVDVFHMGRDYTASWPRWAHLSR